LPEYYCDLLCTGTGHYYTGWCKSYLLCSV